MAKKKATTPSDDSSPDTAHAFADRTNRFPIDDLIRNHGFEIFSRPRTGEPIWIKRLLGGRSLSFRQSEVFRRFIPQYKLADAEYHDALKDLDDEKFLRND